MKKKSIVISAFTAEVSLKRKIRAHLRKLGIVHAPDGSLSSRSSSKESIRALHIEQRRDRLKSHKKFVQEVTTSSSLGRSSVYNRLKLGSQAYLKAIGYTQGWGHFHVPDSLFGELRDYLRKRKHGYEDGHKFGEGPNWRLRTIRAAFDALGSMPIGCATA